MTKGGAITKGKSSQETNYETQGSIFILTSLNDYTEAQIVIQTAYPYSEDNN